MHIPKELIHVFLGIDPAPSEGQRSDDGALVSLAAWPRDLENPSPNYADWMLAPIQARRVRKELRGRRTGYSAREWAGMIHTQHDYFRYSKIGLDPNGGGTFVKRELASNRALIRGVETNVTPLVTPDDNTVAVAHPILFMIKRGDTDIEMVWPQMGGDDLLNDALYSYTKEALDTSQFLFPKPWHEWDREEMRFWPEERVWSLKCLTKVLPDQLEKIIVAVKEDGSWSTTKRGARQFSARGKKDFVSALLYAYAAFRVWLAGSDETWFQADMVGAGFRSF